MRGWGRAASILDAVANVVGWEAHGAGVSRLEASYTLIPPGAPVRLSKPTSNLFRARADTTAPGLDVSGLVGVIRGLIPERARPTCRACAPTRTWSTPPCPTASSRSSSRSCARSRLAARSTGLGIESTLFRNGLPHESAPEMDVFTGAGEVVTVKPGDDLFDAFANPPRLVGLRHPAADRARTGPAARRPAARGNSTGSTTWPPRSTRSPGVGSGRACRWTASMAWRSVPTLVLT